MDKTSKAQAKHIDKQTKDKPFTTTGSSGDTRTLYVGDDTGLLKKVSLKLGYEDIVISEPVQSR
jgi:hypothetical protein